ncbi:MAG: DUF1801 domain-containing protein [Ginsengibacter sp.]
MQSKATTPEQYLLELPVERKEPMTRLREEIVRNLPKGFSEEMSYGMLGYVVPHSIYPAGYHCNTKLPLPFMNLASQKNFIAVYHMGLYADEKLKKWFSGELAKLGQTKQDTGKSSLRFKNMQNIPYDLIGKLASKMNPGEWISLYEKNLKKH